MLRANYVFLVLGAMVIVEPVNCLPAPWEPYHEGEADPGLKHIKFFHDTFYSGVEIAEPMAKKFTKTKLDDYKEKHHGEEAKAGRAGRDRSSEEKSNEFVSRIPKAGPDGTLLPYTPIQPLQPMQRGQQQYQGQQPQQQQYQQQQQQYQQQGPPQGGEGPPQGPPEGPPNGEEGPPPQQ